MLRPALPLAARCPHLIVVAVLTSWSLLGAGEAPLQVGSTKQLFLGPWTEDGRDGHLVESMTGVTIRMNDARATGERLMVQDRPWEGTGMLDMRQFVLKDEDRFRIYYSALPFHTTSESDPSMKNRRPGCGPGHTSGSSATGSRRTESTGRSRSGPRFLERVPGEQHPFSNDDFPLSFSEMEGAWVFIDPDAPDPGEKYKMLVKISPIRDDPSRPKAENLPPPPRCWPRASTPSFRPTASAGGC